MVILGFVLLSIAAGVPVRAQVYDEATIEAQLRSMHQHHTDRLFKWDGPIRFSVSGLRDEAMRQEVVDQFTYLGGLTGLEVRDAKESVEKTNFMLVFYDNYLDLADAPALQSIFRRKGQSDSEYRAMLEELNRAGHSRSVSGRNDNALTFYALLADPSGWADKVLVSNVLRFIVFGLTDASHGDEIQPSVFNELGAKRPHSRLPSFDEAYLRALYSPGMLSGIPAEVAISKLTAAIAADLNN